MKMKSKTNVVFLLSNVICTFLFNAPKVVRTYKLPHVSNIFRKLIPDHTDIFERTYREECAYVIEGTFSNEFPKDDTPVTYWKTKGYFDEDQFTMFIRDDTDTRDAEVKVRKLVRGSVKATNFEYTIRHQDMSNRKRNFPEHPPFEYKTINRDKLYMIKFMRDFKGSDIDNNIFLLKFLETVPFEGMRLETFKYRYFDAQNTKEFELEIVPKVHGLDQYYVKSECFNGTFHFVTEKI